MLILKNLYVGSNPPGVTYGSLEYFLQSLAYKVIQERSSEYYGLLVIYSSTLPTIVGTFQEFLADVSYYVVETKLAYRNLKTHFRMYGPEVQDIRVILNNAYESLI